MTFALRVSIVLSNPPERTKIVLPSVADNPGDAVIVSETLPANPLTLLAAIGVDAGQSAIEEGPVRLQLTVTGVLGEIVKSLKLNVAVAV